MTGRRLQSGDFPEYDETDSEEDPDVRTDDVIGYDRNKRDDNQEALLTRVEDSAHRSFALND